MNTAMTPKSEDSPLSLGPPLVPVREPGSKSTSAATKVEHVEEASLVAPPSGNRGLPLPQSNISSRPSARPLVEGRRARPAYAEARSSTPNVRNDMRLVDKLDVLGQYLNVRPVNAPNFKVVAVDGLDRNAVHLVIANLHYQIVKDLRFTVRVVGEQLPLRSHDTRPPLEILNDQVQYYGSLWDSIWNAPRGLSDVAPDPPPITGQQRHLFPPPINTSAYPYIFIIPMSPLTATLKASKFVGFPGSDGDLNVWRWLASHWGGRWTPDVMVNIQEAADMVHFDHEVIILNDGKIRTLNLTKTREGGVDLTPAQLRRITFEVEEWLYSGQ